jgi:tetratricopeptide (TPR) repeat protein
MARTFLTAAVIILLNVLIGCNGVDSGQGQILPTTSMQSPYATDVVGVTDPGEADIVEQVATNRQAYRQGLVTLIDHYTKMGNNLKLQWAKKELAALDAMPKYKYIIEANVAGPRLEAKARIPEADALYREATDLQKEAERLVLVKSDDKLRLALDKYNQVIRKYPSSDKIDDAAFKAGSIYDHFKDYTIALLYYQRTYQWNPEAPYPARFEAAEILDTHLHRRAEALELYKEALEKEARYGKYNTWREYAEMRIRELTAGD